MKHAAHAPDIAAQQQRRGFWLRTLHSWHWISSAICLVAMLLFAITGITLNHSAAIEAKPETLTRRIEMPASVLRALGTREEGTAPLPGTVGDWLSDVPPYRSARSRRNGRPMRSTFRCRVRAAMHG